MFVNTIKRLSKWILFERYPNFYRPPHKEYISYDTYRSFADHIYDESTTFNPNNVKEGDIVFLNGRFIDNYLKIQNLKIKNSYSLIICGSNFVVDEMYSKILIQKNINHIFSNNLTIEKNDLFTFIPFGIKDKRHIFSSNFKRYLNSTNKSEEFILHLDESLIQDQKEILIKKKTNLANRLINYQSPENYKKFYEMIRNHKFLFFSNEINYDLNIIWESIMLDCYPILKMNAFTKTLSEIGTPCVYLDEFDEIEKFDEKYLLNMYNKLEIDSSKYSLLDRGYWESVIKK
mgnify:CR=1 FL=1|tara:strand:+ start:1092 stop:1958 length:867 start_codon:yes stop_codon:yes gene_type:complete